MNSDLYPYLYAPKDGYVFVVTYGRSGSTLTSNYLNSFPGYCIRGENNYVIAPLCDAIRRLGNYNFSDRRKDNGKPFSDRRADLQRIMGTPKDPWYGAEAVDPDRFAKAMFNDFVKEILSPPIGTRVAGFKEIQWANNLDLIEENLDIISRYFPHTRFVFQTRDVQDIVKSGWWAKRPISEVQRYIQNADAVFQKYAAGNDSCLHIRYEDLTRGNESLRKIADFLEEDFCEKTAHKIINEQLTHLK